MILQSGSVTSGVFQGQVFSRVYTFMVHASDIMHMIESSQAHDSQVPRCHGVQQEHWIICVRAQHSAAGSSVPHTSHVCSVAITQQCETSQKPWLRGGRHVWLTPWSAATSGKRQTGHSQYGGATLPPPPSRAAAAVRLGGCRGIAGTGAREARDVATGRPF